MSQRFLKKGRFVTNTLDFLGRLPEAFGACEIFKMHYGDQSILNKLVRHLSPSNII